MSVTLPELGFRWLTVGPVGQPDIAIVLMAIPGPPYGIDCAFRDPSGNSLRLAQLTEVAFA